VIQIPQSTARVVMLKVFEEGTTTAATGETVAVVISKAGAAFGNPNAGATNATEVSNGWYKVTLDTTDTGTLGDLVVRGTAAGCDDAERIFGVVKATTGGLTALPDALPDAAGGLPVSDAGGLDLDALRADVAAVLVDTAEVGAAGAGLTAVPWNAAWDAEVQSECADALADAGLAPLLAGTALGGAAGTITLDSGSVDGYTGQVVRLTGGTGAGQARLVTAYEPMTGVASVSPNWTIAPDATSTFAVLPVGPAGVELWRRVVPAAVASSGYVRVDLRQIDGDATAAGLSDLAGDYTNGALNATVNGDVVGKVLGEAGPGGTITGVGAWAAGAAGAAVSTLTAAQVNTEVDAALADYDPPTHAELTAAAGAVTLAVGGIPTAAENAAAWGTSVVGDGRTRDYFLQGGTNLVTFAADGLSWTLYATDDATPLQAGTATRLAASVGGLRGVDPT
jgi:hypothetical protein